MDSRSQSQEPATSVLIRPAALIATVASLCLTTALGGRPADATEGKRLCAPSGSRMLTGSREARLYETRDGLLAGCRFANGRERILVEENWFPPPVLDLAGSIAGYVEVDTFGVGPGPPTVVLEDLTRPLSRARLRSFEVGDPGALRITRRGGVAWIECEGDAEGVAVISPSCRRLNSLKRVYKRDFPGAGPDSNVLLDEGRGIPINSLQLRGRRVTWLKRGTRRSAEIR